MPPDWVEELLGPSVQRRATPGEVALEVTRNGRFCLASARVPNARSLGRAEFQEAAARAYRFLAAELKSERFSHPVRLWNHIPGIHDSMGEGEDRYMAFNAGRFEALSEWFGGPGRFDTGSVSASGVGHDGEDLVIHCLAADRPGEAVDNPRQVPPHRYSRRWGTLPPCFARATVLQTPEPRVLVGGTASIVGEDSVHVGDLARQTEETLTNLAVLLGAAVGEEEPAGDRAALAAFQELRVYYPDPGRLEELRGLIDGAFPGVGEIEWVRADLCRAELLVEIEGVAGLRPL